MALIRKRESPPDLEILQADLRQSRAAGVGRVGAEVSVSTLAREKGIAKDVVQAALEAEWPEGVNDGAIGASERPPMDDGADSDYDLHRPRGPQAEEHAAKPSRSPSPSRSRSPRELVKAAKANEPKHAEAAQPAQKAEGEDQASKFDWERAFVAVRDTSRETGLPALTRLVLLVIGVHMKADGKHAHPGQARVAREAGISLAAAKFHLQLAQERGWIKRDLTHRSRFGVGYEYIPDVPSMRGPPRSPATSFPGKHTPRKRRRR